jgi:phosphate transport system substrate-binding protein
MFTKTLALILAGTMLVATSASAAEVKINGSTTVAGALVEAHKADIEKASGHTLTVVANGSGHGLTDLAEGKANIAMISAPLEEVAAKINEKTPGAIDVAAFQVVQVGEAKVAFVANSANKVKELTNEKITAVLKGTTTNWKDLGGDDAPVLVVTEVSGGGIRSLVEGELLAKEAIAANKRELPNGSQIVKIVSQIPGALGVVSASQVDASVAQIKTDKDLVQPLILVTKGAPSAEAQAVIDAAKAAYK